jgi:SnoaL-like domain
MPVSDSATTGARELAQRFIDAFNDRDMNGLRALIAPDATLRTLTGDALHGHEGLDALLRAAEDLDVRLVPFRTPHVERDGEDVHVTAPIRELIGPDDIERTVELDISDGRIVGFAVRPFTDRE